MVKDAHITQDDIADSVSLLSVTFIILQPFSTAIGRRLGPKYWIACMMVLWGAVSMAHAGIKNRGTLIALRLLLGAFEAGFVPTSFVSLNTALAVPIANAYASITCLPSIPNTRSDFVSDSFPACTRSRELLQASLHTASSK